MTKNDDDILAALEGRPKPAELARENAIMQAAWGTTEESNNALAVWAAHEAAAAATKKLAEAIMRADGSKGIYLAESEAKAITAEAYATAVKMSPHEEERQERVARYVTKLAEDLSCPRKTALTSQQAANKSVPVAKGVTSQEAAGRRRIRIAEGGSGRIISVTP